MQMKPLTDAQTRAWLSMINELHDKCEVLHGMFANCTHWFYDKYTRTYERSWKRFMYDRFDSYEEFLNSPLQFFASCGTMGCGFFFDGPMYKPFGITYSKELLEFQRKYHRVCNFKKIREVHELWTLRAVHPMIVTEEDIRLCWSLSRALTDVTNIINDYSPHVDGLRNKLDTSELNVLLTSLRYKYSENYKL